MDNQDGFCLLTSDGRPQTFEMAAKTQAKVEGITSLSTALWPVWRVPNQRRQDTVRPSETRVARPLTSNRWEHSDGPAVQTRFGPVHKLCSWSNNAETEFLKRE